MMLATVTRPPCNGPTPHPMITDPPPTDSAAVPAPREKLDSEFSEEENKLEMIQQREGRSVLMSTKLSCYGNESIHDFFVRFQSARGKKVICYNCRGEGHVARQCKEQKRKMDSQYFKDKALLMEAKRKGDIESGDEPGRTFRLDARLRLNGTYDPFHQYLLDTGQQKMFQMRQEQALVIQRNKRNAELVQENDLLKSTLSGKEKSIAFLQSEKEKILSEKKDLADSYLDEIVCLKNANKVARDILQRFNMPTETIPMFFKKPKKATADLHKDLLGTRNPGLGYMAKRAQPALYDAAPFAS
ncbi:copia protein [Tanacetum coccineum]|uniref:Copia protein n=1 Tax=Tanacetum coccineum TaxID=301880 RepID=A0ABQ5H1E8_9ASTR